jgi:hypothetical protein
MNEGTALDISNGVFLAPAPGKYFFAYSGYVGTMKKKSNYRWRKPEPRIGSK